MRLIQYSKNLTFLALLSLNFLAFGGCAQKKEIPEVKKPIEKEFITSFQANNKLNYQLDANTKIVDKTFWIYVATDKEIISLETQKSEDLPPKIVKFIDVKSDYKNSIFSIGYIFLKHKPEEYSLFQDKNKKTQDILQEKSLSGKEIYPESTNTLLEIFNKIYITIGDIISDAKDINFFVIAIADIKRGVKSTYVIHKLDLEKSLLRMLPDEEFSNRIFRRNLKDPEIKNDKYGLHINYVDISLIDFLKNQIETNVYGKIYEMQKFEAKKLQELEDLQDIVLRAVYDVAINYEFYDFYLVETLDLLTKKSSSVSKSSLMKKFNEQYSIESPVGTPSQTQ